MTDGYESITGPEGVPSISEAAQINTADHVQTPGVRLCGVCGRPYAGPAFLLDSKLMCAVCAQGAGTRPASGNRSAMVRGLLFVAGAVLLGLVIYAAFTIAKHH